MNEPRLILELGRYRELVFGRVVVMPESLRGKGEVCNITGTDGENFTIRSSVSPELCGHGVYIAGDARDRDDLCFYKRYPNEATAISVVANIKTCVKKINARFAKETQRAAVTLEQID